jgi:hypothetical protein
VNRDNQNDLFSRIEYLLIRLLLMALLLIGAYKLLEREIYGASANTEVKSAVAHLQTEPGGDRVARQWEKSNEEAQRSFTTRD